MFRDKAKELDVESQKKADLKREKAERKRKATEEYLKRQKEAKIT